MAVSLVDFMIAVLATNILRVRAVAQTVVCSLRPMGVAWLVLKEPTWQIHSPIVVLTLPLVVLASTHNEMKLGSVGMKPYLSMAFSYFAAVREGTTRGAPLVPILPPAYLVRGCLMLPNHWDI